jgi:phosphoglycerate dehydrogenase-like enzyme
MSKQCSDGKATPRPRVVVCTGAEYAKVHIIADDLVRLGEFAFIDVLVTDDRAVGSVNQDSEARRRLEGALTDADALVLGPGAPRVDAELLRAGSRLRFVGELEGDRLSPRLDLAAAWTRGISTVDTTNASSYPVAEWTVAALILSFRNAGAMFRAATQSRAYVRPLTDPGYTNGGIEGRQIALLGCGHIGRRLVRYLRPYDPEIVVHDPLIEGALAEELGVSTCSLEAAFDADAVVCLLPLTPSTTGLIGADLLGRMRPGSVFVNVSRGAVVDSAALVARLSRGDIVAAIDVFEPEPVPADSPLKTMANVFLTPHIAGVTARSRPYFFALMVDELHRHFGGRGLRFALSERTARMRGLTPSPRDVDTVAPEREAGPEPPTEARAIMCPP